MINRQLLMATTAAVVLAMPAVSGAQDGASPAVPVTQDAQPDQVDEIVVTGIRRSIQDAISAKRNSDILLDTISAEDIGKLPDQNIAETLSRIPGVQISRVEGGGQQVTVRGLGLNRLLLNGNSFIGSANNGDPNLGDVSPELLGSVDVIKAPAADLVEGWLGAIIDLKTKRPLDYVEPILAFRLQGSHADQIDDYGYKASGVLSRRFLDGTLGALVGFSYAESSGRTDLYQSGGWSRQRADVNGDGVVDTFFRPNRLQTIINQYEDERWALNGTLQWRPFQQLTITADAFSSRREAERARFAQQTILTNAITNGQLSASNSLLRGDFAGATLRPLVYNGDSWAESTAFSLNADLRLERWNIRFNASESEGESLGRNAENNANSPGNDSVLVVRQIAGNTVAVNYDAAGSDLSPDYGLTTNFDILDPAQYEVFTVVDFVYPSLNTGRDVALDFEYFADWGHLTSIKFGGRLEDLSVYTAQADGIYPTSFTAFDPTPGNSLRGNEAPGLRYTGPIGDIFDGIGGNFPRVVLGGFADPAVFRRGLGAVGPDLSGAASQRSIRDVDLTTDALYVKASFEGELLGLPYLGNIGVRHIQSERTSRGFDLNVATNQIVAREVPVSFEHTLPSANLILNPREDLSIRFAAAKVVARPRLNDTGVGVLLAPVTGTGSGGNPLLRPYEANQYDVSVEWYFAPASLLSVALFQKDVGTFIAEEVVQEVFPDAPRNALPVGDPARFTYDITRPVNGSDAEVSGFEVNYQQSLSFLPGLWSGLGYAVTYTYSDSETQVVDELTGETLPLPNASKHSANFIAYYEQGPFSARLAYNTRSSYLLARQGAVNAGSLFNAGRGQLDGQLSYRVNDVWTIQLEAVNITKEITSQYNGSAERLNDAWRDDRRVYLGVAASF